MTGRRWPWQGDSPEARAHYIANWLLDWIVQHNRPEAMRRVQIAHGWGEDWLGTALLAYDDADIVTTSEAAQLLGMSTDTIRKLTGMPHPDPRQAARGRRLLTSHGRRGHQNTYLVADLRRAADAYQAELTRRAQRRRGAPTSDGS